MLKKKRTFSIIHCHVPVRSENNSNSNLLSKSVETLQYNHQSFFCLHRSPSRATPQLSLDHHDLPQKAGARFHPSLDNCHPSIGRIAETLGRRCNRSDADRSMFRRAGLSPPFQFASPAAKLATRSRFLLVVCRWQSTYVLRGLQHQKLASLPMLGRFPCRLAASIEMEEAQRAASVGNWRRGLDGQGVAYYSHRNFGALFGKLMPESS